MKLQAGGNQPKRTKKVHCHVEYDGAGWPQEILNIEYSMLKCIGRDFHVIIIFSHHALISRTGIKFVLEY